MDTKFLIRFATMYRVSPEEITGKSRDRFLFYLRVILANELRKRGMRKYEIAKYLQRKKSTAGYYLKQFQACKRYDKKFNNYLFYFKNNQNLWRITNLKRRRMAIK